MARKIGSFPLRNFPPPFSSDGEVTLIGAGVGMLSSGIVILFVFFIVIHREGESQSTKGNKGKAQ
jgi:hypothetical protein